MNFAKHQHALVECVPNFSEGRDPKKVEAIVSAIASVEGVYVLHVDRGVDANRTVITFAGQPALVVEAATKAIAKAAELIDMTLQTGEHPRLGATDVCPLIPMQNISAKDLLPYAEELGKRVGAMDIPVYLYEQSAKAAHRTRLEQIRKGQYEQLAARMQHEDWKPDYGPTTLNPQTGATVIGVRDFLIAYNVNLGTKDVAIAKDIAKRIRSSGYKRDGEAVPGLLSNLKAIGWYMDEYGCAQVSTNLTNFHKTPLHVVYDTISDLAEDAGTQVTGSELIGLIPKEAILQVGEYAMRKERSDVDSGEDKMIRAGLAYLGLTAVKPIERILEYTLGMAYRKKRLEG